MHGHGLKVRKSVMDNRDYKPHENGSIAALTTIGVALAATGNTVGYILLAVIVGYLIAK